MAESSENKEIKLRKQFDDYLHDRYIDVDKTMQNFVLGFFGFGILLAFFYETWIFAFGVGGACVAAYYIVRASAIGTKVSRLTISVIFCIFMLQFISQMHGLYEMHFFFFINIAILIMYKDWHVMIPYTGLTVIHHTILFYLQMQGYDVKNYNINVDNLTYTIIAFHLGLAAFMAVVSSWWSIILKEQAQQEFENKQYLERQLVQMSKNIEFASAISKGDLHADYASDDVDELGKSLIEMRESLHDASAREEKEKFKNVGIAEVSSILRDHASNLKELSFQVIAQIVRYMKINQGGIFILNADDPNHQFLELTGCYAFERKKFIEKQIEVGEGLVGQAVLEKEYIYMTNIPESYVSITSGLGTANPRSILIVPLKSDEKVVGAMEFASFKEFKDFEIDFLEKVGENIAAAILSAQINEKTSTLLEQSQQQTEEMRAQEEEMRQNMEELQATQEEIHRKVRDYEAMIKEKDDEIALLKSSIKESEPQS